MNTTAAVLTTKEYKLLTTYLSRIKNGGNWIVNPIECLQLYNSNISIKSVSFGVNLGLDSSVDIYIKGLGGHISLSNPEKKETLLGVGKIYCKFNGVFSRLEKSDVSSQGLVILNKINKIIESREIVSEQNLLVNIKKFVIACDSLLEKHFYIDNEIDSYNSTSDAVFNFCAGVGSRSYKQKHWETYMLDGHKRPYESIITDLSNVMVKNSIIFNDEIDAINSGYVNRDQAKKITAIIESSKIKSSISLKRDFLEKVFVAKELNQETTINGVVFGVTQKFLSGKASYSLNVKSDEGELVEIESGSEFFCGLITKESLIEIVDKKIPVTIHGSVVAANKGITIAGKVIFPPSTRVKATSLHLNRNEKKSINLNLKP